MKRGVSTFPFLVIFVMIAGAVILGFFFGFGKGLLGFSESVTDATILRSLDQQLAAFTNGHNLKNDDIYWGKETEVVIGCFDGKTNASVIGKDKKVSTMYPKKLIVSPGNLDGEKISAWTYSWFYPFKVDNVYFVTNEKTFFYFYRPSSGWSDPNKKEKEGFFDNFPETFNRFPFTNVNSLSLSPRSTKVFVYFGTGANNPCSSCLNEQNAKVRKVDFVNNKVYFCDKKGANCKEKPYLGEAMAYAAIFSRNLEDYECIEAQAIEKLKWIIELYKFKAEKMKASNRIVDPMGVQCEVLYSQFESTLTTLSGDTKYLNSLAVKTANEQITKQGCPGVYEA